MDVKHTRRVAWLVFGWLAVSYAYFFQGGGWNPNARFDMTRAIAEQGTFSINAYVENTGDYARVGDLVYSNKAPGLSVVSVPIYLALLPAASAWVDDEDVRLTLLGYGTNLFTNALPAAGLGVLMFYTLGWLGVARLRDRAFCAIAFGLGTLAFPYATAYYAHLPTAGLCFAALAVLLRAREAAVPRSLGFASGALAGAAVLFESTAVLCPLVLAGALALDTRGRRILPAFILGGLPWIGVLGAYNASVTGSPFEMLLTHYNNPGVEIRVEGSVITWPTFERLWGLTFSSYRGLFFTSPLLLFGVITFPMLYRRDRFVLGVCAALPLAFLLLNASYTFWQGSWAPGPRFLVPCLPYLFIPTAFALTRGRLGGIGVSMLSAAAMLAITATAVEVPAKVEVPLYYMAIALLRKGHVSANSQGLDDYWYAEEYGVADPALDWNSFNLGELLFPGSAWSLVPLLILWLGFGYALYRATEGLEPSAKLESAGSKSK